MEVAFGHARNGKCCCKGAYFGNETTENITAAGSAMKKPQALEKPKTEA